MAVALPVLRICCIFAAMRDSSAEPPPVAAMAFAKFMTSFRAFPASMPVARSAWFACTSDATSNGVLAASFRIASSADFALSASPIRVVNAVWYCSICALNSTPALAMLSTPRTASAAIWTNACPMARAAPIIISRNAPVPRDAPRSTPSPAFRPAASDSLSTPLSSITTLYITFPSSPMGSPP